MSLCECGCGHRTAIAKRSDARKGWVKGEPFRFIYGHHTRKSPLYWVEEDRGYDTPCRIWQRATNGRGYGQLATHGRKSLRAHRAFYEHVHGPVSPDLVLDHLCGNTLCVRIDHLEPVTQAENVRRGREGSIR